MLYIDFDGVILDTEDVLFEEWRKQKNHKLLEESKKIEYVATADWNFILNNSPIINDAVYYLKNMDPETSFILTKVHSLTNEGSSKIKWIRDQGIKQSVILVPYNIKKCDMVPVKDNILVDDCLRNLKEWEDKGGIPLFFDMDDDGLDSWEQPNTYGYQKVLTLKNINKKD